MIVIQVPLQQVIVDVEHDINLASLPKESAIAHLAEAYAFLPSPTSIDISDGMATVSSDGESKITGQTARIFEKAGAEARRGRYSQAADLYRRVIEQAPGYAEAHYNLGMAYLEMDDHRQAETYVINALNLRPDDPYFLLLLGNIYLKYRGQPDVAEQLYSKAASVAPADPYILSNIGGLLLERDQYIDARAYFDQAIAADPEHPHAYYGKALAYQREEDYEAAAAVLEDLFSEPESIDIRSEPVYQEARKLYLQCTREISNTNVDQHLAYVRDWRDRLEEEGGVEIELVHDPSLSLPAMAEIAWHRSNRKAHVIRYRDRQSPELPHLIAHELQHIALEMEARQANRNRFFITTDVTRDNALRSISGDINKLKRSGELGGHLEAFIDQIVYGLTNQIFNTPLDFVIEHRLYHEHPILRPSQFISLQEIQRQNLQVLNDGQIKRVTPRTIYNANLSLNAAYAMFADDLLRGSTDFTEPYENTRYLRTARPLFSLWIETRDDLQPGGEYQLVDRFAETLRLQRWYEWADDVDLPPEEGGGTTNEELLKAKEPAAIMYCLSALNRFEDMKQDEIRHVVAEIAILGQTGLDYASSDKKYSLQTLPGEAFSGLQLMCLMYVGLKDIDPAVDAGMDLEEPYQAALLLHNAQQQ